MIGVPVPIDGLDRALVVHVLLVVLGAGVKAGQAVGALSVGKAFFAVFLRDD